MIRFYHLLGFAFPVAVNVMLLKDVFIPQALGSTMSVIKANMFGEAWIEAIILIISTICLVDFYRLNWKR